MLSFASASRDDLMAYRAETAKPGNEVLESVGDMPAIGSRGTPAANSAGRVHFLPGNGVALRTVTHARIAPAGADALLALIVRIRRHEEAALTALHGACAQRVFACAMGVLRLPELADEVVSVCFMQAWRDAAEFDERRSGVISRPCKSSAARMKPRFFV